MYTHTKMCLNTRLNNVLTLKLLKSIKIFQSYDHSMFCYVFFGSRSISIRHCYYMPPYIYTWTGPAARGEVSVSVTHDRPDDLETGGRYQPTRPIGRWRWLSGRASACGVRGPRFESHGGRCFSRQLLRYTALGTGCAPLLCPGTNPPPERVYYRQV